MPQVLKVLIRRGRRFSALVAIAAVISFGAAPVLAQTMVADAQPGLTAGRSGPLQVVTSSISRVLTMVRSQPADATESGKRQAEIRQAAVELFDLDEMSRLLLGQRWTDASPREQQDFIVLFTDLLQGAYLNSIGNYPLAAITFLSRRSRSRTRPSAARTRRCSPGWRWVRERSQSNTACSSAMGSGPCTTSPWTA
jgi:ABC-type transporter MlaC component